MADRLEVIAARLLVSDVRVDTRIASCTCQILALAERNVLTVRVFVALSETKIDDVDAVLVGIVSADEEVIRLDISVNNALFVDFLNSLNLYSNIYN